MIPSTLLLLVVAVFLLGPASAFLAPHHIRPSATPAAVLSQLFGTHKGTVKWFDSTKGFGFITRDDDGEDVFVHQSGIQAEGFRSLEDGSSVEFDILETEDGKTKAVDVTGPNGEGLPRGYAYKKREE